jgi:hypothetical protein
MSTCLYRRRDEFTVPHRLGVDIACRAAHQASLADERGRLIWTGRRFRTTLQDLYRLWSCLPEGTDPAQVLVVMEPTRNAWVPLAAWFRRRGAQVVLVPPERSADLRNYYAKHSKSNRLDSQLLARLPMLHPVGCMPSGAGSWQCTETSGEAAFDADASAHPEPGPTAGVAGDSGSCVACRAGGGPAQVRI